MHIIYDGIIYSLQKQGGITRYANELIRGVSAKHKTTVLTHKTTFTEPPAGSGIEHVSCTRISIPFGNTLLKYPLYPIDKFQTERFLKRQNYQNAIFHSTYFSSYDALSIPQIITVHDMTHERSDEFRTMKDKLFIRQKRNAIKKAAHIICISESSAKDLQQIYEIPAEKISVVPNGVSEIFFEDTSKDEIEHFKKAYNIQKPFLLFVGKRSGYKNFETFIEAYAAWDNSDIDLVAVGGGDLTAKEKSMLEKLKVTDRVHYLGQLDDRDLKRAYYAAYAFVFPSSYEGFGMPLLEAYACGTRVLASDIPVFHELAGDTPIYVNPLDIESMRAGLNTLASAQTVHDREYRIVTAESYRWENTVARTIDVYSRVARA